jgi:hypothetical protein
MLAERNSLAAIHPIFRTNGLNASGFF